MPPTYMTPKPYHWHTVQPLAQYTAAPQFKPPTPPPVFLPQNPFLPEPEPEPEPPEEEPPPAQEAPAEEDLPPPDAGIPSFCLLILCTIMLIPS